ncbi:MAG TPA: DUF6515 family protein [Steroidobacteraceae bacterium]|nr:DUF6515 family protein [Steroidobacteraceae bacterium]
MNCTLRSLTSLGLIAALLSSGVALADRDHDRRHEEGRYFDNRYQHGHYYLPRGHVVEALPHAAISVNIGGGPFYFHEGIWYRPHGPRFIVAAPPFGVVIPVLPPFYTTLWVRGIPYYYANDVYYTWRPEAHGYAVTDPPSESDVTVKAEPSGNDLFIYPKNAQSESQQSTDRYECHRWANEQTNYDPTRPGGGVSSSEASGKRADYFRAMTACLEGRGYTVK